MDLQKYLQQNGVWTDCIADAGAEDGCCLYADFIKHTFGIWRERGLYVVRVDGSEYTVDCPTKEDVLRAIKFGLYCFGMKDILEE